MMLQAIIFYILDFGFGIKKQTEHIPKQKKQDMSQDEDAKQSSFLDLPYFLFEIFLKSLTWLSYRSSHPVVFFGLFGGQLWPGFWGPGLPKTNDVFHVKHVWTNTEDVLGGGRPTPLKSMSSSGRDDNKK